MPPSGLHRPPGRARSRRTFSSSHRQDTGCPRSTKRSVARSRASACRAGPLRPSPASSTMRSAWMPADRARRTCSSRAARTLSTTSSGPMSTPPPCPAIRVTPHSATPARKAASPRPVPVVRHHGSGAEGGTHQAARSRGRTDSGTSSRATRASTARATTSSSSSTSGTPGPATRGREGRRRRRRVDRPSGPGRRATGRPRCSGPPRRARPSPPAGPSTSTSPGSRAGGWWSAPGLSYRRRRPPGSVRATGSDVRRAGRTATCGTAACGGRRVRASEQVQELLAGIGVVLDPVEEAVEKCRHVLGVPHVVPFGEARLGQEAPGVGRLGDPTQQCDRLLVVAPGDSSDASAGTATGWSGSSCRARRNGSSAPASARPPPAGPPPSRRRARAATEGAHLGLRPGPDELVDDRAVLHGEDRGRLATRPGSCSTRPGSRPRSPWPARRRRRCRSPPAPGGDRAWCRARTTVPE